MSEDPKKVETTTPAIEAENKPAEPKSEEDASKKIIEEQPQEGEVDTVDFKALYEKEQNARKKAEHKIVKMKTKSSVDEIVEEDDDFQENDMKSYLDKKLSEIQYNALQNQYDTEIDNQTTNPDEKKLILLHLEDNTFSGSVREQVQKARALANFERVALANKELAHSQSVQPSGADSSSYQQPKDQTSKILAKLSPMDRAFLEKRGRLDDYVKAQIGKK